MSNLEHAHRHAYYALADFEIVRHLLRTRGKPDYGLLHSISHHLRHAVYRTGLELPSRSRRYVRRSKHEG